MRTKVNSFEAHSIKSEINYRYIIAVRLMRRNRGVKMPYHYYYDYLEYFCSGIIHATCYNPALEYQEFSALLEYKNLVLDRFLEKFPNK